MSLVEQPNGERLKWSAEWHGREKNNGAIIDERSEVINYWMRNIGMTSLADLTECTRPVFVEDPESEEFPYGSLGSGFSIFYDGNYYFVTLTHVIKNSKPENLVIMINDHMTDLLPFDQLTGSISPSVEESDIGDIRLLRIPNDLLNKIQLNSLCALNLDRFRSLYLTPRPDETAVISGYPAERKMIDYKKKGLKYQRFTAEGVVRGVSSEEHLYKIELIKQDEVHSMSGMSGSPVFIFGNASNGAHNARFGGVVTRGGLSGDPLFVHFVDSAVVFRMLERLGKDENP